MRYGLNLILAMLVYPSLMATEIYFDFQQTPQDGLPEGFEALTGGTGREGKWGIVQDEVPGFFPSFSKEAAASRQRAVLAQLSEDLTEERYPMLIYAAQTFRDGQFSVKFKLVRGIVETMAGLVFRYQDPNNYYYIRASGNGRSFAFFKVVDGVRGEPVRVTTELALGQWHSMGVTMKGPQFDILLNGEKPFPQLTDHTFNQGKVGFWTKSDAVSYFADARLDFQPMVIAAQQMVERALEDFPRVLELMIYAPREPGQSASVIASKDAARLDLPEDEAVRAAITESKTYYQRDKAKTTVTLPLVDRNGDPVAALRIGMKSFAGQTRANALTRAIPIAQQMQRQILDLRDLYQ
ncbi:MAG: hypothetical protein ACO3VS_04455 [Limisphaerales bacterium]